MLAPIVLFIYNRPDHTQKTLRALSENLLAKESSLYIYADGPKAIATEAQKAAILETRRIAKSEQWCKEVTIIESDTNKGLAASIIAGVTEVVNKYGKVIVLEDDLVTSPYFLTYMNDGLDFYAEEQRVWHISGYMYPINRRGVADAFLWYTMDCWGWATWSDRWQHYEKNPDKLIKEFTAKDIYKFNIYNSENMWGQVIDNKTGKIDTWGYILVCNYF